MTMHKGWWKKLVYVAISGLLLGLLAYSFIPNPVVVDTRPVIRGTVQVTVEDDGQTQVREKYVISSPLGGRLARVQLHAGDVVRAGETTLTTLEPTSPALLDARSRAEAAARLKAAEAAHKRSEPARQLAYERVQIAAEEFDRAKQLHARNGISHEERDRAEHRWRAASEELRIAEFALQISAYELELARAALLHTQRPAEQGEAGGEDWQVVFRAPINGRVLRVFQESAAVVTAGTPLMAVGEPGDLEVVIDVLSSDAVKIAPGNPVVLEEWGGARPLQAHVRHVEPSGFTKVSALGVEEKRVNVMIDLDSPPAERPELGDEFRVEARIIVDQVNNVLKIPNGALFGAGETSAVYVISKGRARMQPVTVGRRGRREVEVVDGLIEGEQVVVYPSDKVRPGVRLKIQ